MSGVIAWVSDPANLVLVFGFWMALLGIAQVVVRLTPSKKDDSILAGIGAVTEKLRNLLSIQKPQSKSQDQNK